MVASANNGAVENITAEIPGSQGIGAQWLEAAARLDYFTATARLVHGDGAWAMIAARLGNAANRRAFADKFWWGAPGRQEGCMVDELGRLAGRAVRWDAARDEFLAAKEKVELLAAERTKAALALSRLPALRRDAATVYASIAAAEDTLRALAGQRVAAERSLRAACHRHQAAAKALDEHARAKPGLRASLSTRFRARQDWRATQGALDAALCDRAALVSTAQRAIARDPGPVRGGGTRPRRGGGHAAPPDRRMRRRAGGDRARHPAVGRALPVRTGVHRRARRRRRHRRGPRGNRRGPQGTGCPVGGPGVRRRAHRAVPRRARAAQGAHHRAGTPGQEEPERAR